MLSCYYTYLLKIDSVTYVVTLLNTVKPVKTKSCPMTARNNSSIQLYLLRLKPSNTGFFSDPLRLILSKFYCLLDYKKIILRIRYIRLSIVRGLSNVYICILLNQNSYICRTTVINGNFNIWNYVNASFYDMLLMLWYAMIWS